MTAWECAWALAAMGFFPIFFGCMGLMFAAHEGESLKGPAALVAVGTLLAMPAIVKCFITVVTQ